MWRRIVPLLSALLMAAPAVASGQTVTAVWDPSSPADQVTGYEVCIGTVSLGCNVQLSSVGSSQTSLTFSPAGGVLHFVAVRAINPSGVGGYSTETTFSIPLFQQPQNRSTAVSTAITPVNFSVTDPDGSALSFSHTGLPIGLSINQTTGQISGTPTTVGTYNVTVFVTDSLTTVSQSFVWTVTGPSADTTAPALSVTSHTNGQVLTTSSVTISGTATDSGSGGSGITSVRVNGQAATGATASGSGTAAWSRALTLVSGSNALTIEAYDGAGNVNMQQFTLNGNLTTAPVTAATLSANLASPQKTGTAITFAASGSGGAGPREYKFLVQQGSGAAQTVRNWSTTANHTWIPTTATSYTVTVWVRSAGVTTDAAQASAQMAYVVTAAVAPLAITGLTSALASPQAAGTAVTFTAAATGGTSPYQYKWWLFNGATWTMVRDWSTTPTYTWTPTVAGANYRVGIWARDATTTADSGAVNLSVPFMITASSSAPPPRPTPTPAPSQVQITGLTSNLASPQATGTVVTFTAGASGGTAPYQYKWWLFNGATWTMVRDWSTTSTYTWTPTAPGANYRVGIWARDATTTTDSGAVNLSVAFAITGSAPAPPPPPTPTPVPSAVRISGVTSNLASPQAPGTAVTFTAGASGGTAPYQYKWWLFNGVAWTMVRDWSTTPTYTWTATGSGNYRIGIWVRDATTTADSGAVNLSVPFAVSASTPPPPASPSTLRATGLTSSVAYPRADGTPIMFTAWASGGTAPYQYKWWIWNGDTWVMARDWGGENYAWTPPRAGGYRVGIWVRDATTGADTGGVNLSIPIVVAD